MCERVRVKEKKKRTEMGSGREEKRASGLEG